MLSVFKNNQEAVKNDAAGRAQMTNAGRNGVKYQGSRKNKSVFSSFLDRNQTAQNFENRIVNKWGAEKAANGKIQRGTAGVSVFQMIGADGEPAENATLNLGGVQHTAGIDGKFRVISREFLREEQELATQRNKYIDSTVAFLSSSDEIAADVLFSGNDETLKIVLDDISKGGNANLITQAEAGGDADYAKAINESWAKLPRSVQEASGMPSVLQVLDPNSNVFSMGSSRLRWIVGLISPVVDSTEDGQQESREDTSRIVK